ncbi:transporter substrate-binding domain-containing protein [Thalassotalea sp. G2M2-11]|uniref:substrate-binding periplasmic protein n=1 Tax=Thalassotalea sp. G2M2-11 TaxID=2787627 RepID=UPI0019D14AED|nr:transporter substrate-binding domain-containing protein [Thalassotalea sp. G2M2-11]
MKLCGNYKYIFYLAVSLFLSSPSYATSPLKVFSYESKLLQYQENNQLKGPSAEIFKMLMAEAKISAKVHFVPWSRAFKLASTQANTMIFSMLRTEEREEQFYWLLAVSEAVRAFISLKSREDLNITKMSQAKSKVTAIIRESYGFKLLTKRGFEPGKNLYVVSNIDTAISLFINGKVDFLFTDPIVIKHYFLEKGQLSENLIKSHIFPETRHKSYIAINRQSDSYLVNTLQKSAERVKQHPKYQYYYHFKPLID